MMALQSKQRGLSLVELMVAVTIGLLIMLVIAQLFLSNRQTYALQEDAARVQESGRFSLTVLDREVRMAGFKRYDCALADCVFDDAVQTKRAVFGEDNPAGAVNHSDTIYVRYYGSDGTVAGTADNTVMDCLGNAAATTTLVYDKFYVANDATNNNEPTLFCQRLNADGTSNGAATPLVPGVESMQVLYGIDTNTGDSLKIVGAYVRSDQVADWGSVLSVKIGLLVRSPGLTSPTTDSKKYELFGQSYTDSLAALTDDPGAEFNSSGSALDKRLRRVFQTTITLRNRVN